MIRRPLLQLMLGVTFFTALAACAPAGDKPTTIRDLLYQLPFLEDTPEPNILRQQISQDLQEQRPDRALLRMQEACATDNREKCFTDLYPVIINALLDQAKAAVSAPDRAGALYRLAQQGLSMAPVILQNIRLSATEIDQRIEQCADELMQQGLKLYRDGQYSAALDTWDRISAFCPQHRPSKNAIKTTRTQLRTLEQISKDSKT
jgi:hypothetical protein